MAVIKLNKLTKYYGKAKGIQDLSLEVQPGEIFGFIGPNGAGKSTTIRTLLGFIKPTSGDGHILGQSIHKDLSRIKHQIGYLPSEVTYYDDMTGEKLLKYSASFYKGDYNPRIRELASYFEVDLSKKIEDLSYGNKKKIAIIQTLLHSPKLLILDEPTGGLDPLMQSKFFDLLEEEKKKGTTIFFSSHVLSEVQRMCTHVGIVKDGALIEVATMDDIKKIRYKKIRIKSEDPIKDHQLSSKLIKDLHINGNEASFIFTGPMNLITPILETIPLKDLWIEDSSLEEIFMHYYS
jgi:ABC-2 type transport system ATP-binding protein